MDAHTGFSARLRTCAACFARVCATFLLAACSTRQNALEPASIYARRVAHLGWLFFITCGVVYIIVIVLALVAAFRNRPNGAPDITPNSERRTGRIVTGGVAATLAILLVFLVASFVVGHDVGGVAPGDALVIDVTGHQWWWEVRYEDSIPQRMATTANEVHIPVGRRVLLHLKSSDVIHSFWVPNLNGKRDLIPGHTTSLFLRADHAGTYRGQCAEFCGLQHAHMSMLVIAEPVDKFNAWLAHERQEAPPPADSIQMRGQNVFLTSSCVMCHAIAGSPAGAHLGPDLTHVAERRTIAAGTLPNHKGSLAGWIVNAQSIKPGALMPDNQLDPEDLQALLVYLENLK